jgi:uncharacterized membrane protein
MAIQPKEIKHEGVPPHPALVEAAEHRAQSLQNRIADAITRFAGSMWFVYVSIAFFGVWMIFFENKPWFMLTLIVSLEAIFLSTFVMISQNRADVKRQIFADHQYDLVQTESKQNEELLSLSKQILDLTKEVHALARSQAGPQGGAAS